MGLVDNQDIRAMHAEAMRLRASVGLPSQTLTEKSCVTAQNWADYMARTGDVRHGGGEHVISWHSDPRASVTSCFAGWMNSSGHRDWILSPAPRLCGWGIARSSKGTYWAGRWESLNPHDPGEGGSTQTPPTTTPKPVPKPTSTRRRPFLDFLRKWFGF